MRKIILALIGFFVLAYILFERLNVPTEYFACVLLAYMVTATKICLDLKYRE